jgi:DNA-binding MarR family transcriptional regulator
MTDNATLRAIERSITQMVRSMGRGQVGRGTERRLEGLVDFSHVRVIAALAECHEAKVTASVGQLARRMAIDPSRASRMAAKAIRAGYAKRLASQDDGRRTCVALTKKGEEFDNAIRDLRLRYFASHMKGWPEEDCKTFARLLSKFLREDEVSRQDSEEDPPDSAQAPDGRDAVVLLHPSVTGPKQRGKRRRQ